MMKLTRFTAKNVYGYLNLKIVFNDDLSFLIGGNGSGKSTTLRLIQSILTPNLKDIYLIPFEKMELSFKKDKKVNKIIIEKNHKNIIFYLNRDKENQLCLDNVDEDELNFILSRQEKAHDYFNQKIIENKHNQILQFIHQIEVPLFLGLERRETHSRDEERQNFPIHFEQITNRDGEKRVIRRNRYIDGSLSLSLMETQEIIRTAYEKIRRIENEQRMKLRDNIILSSFNYTELMDLVDHNGEFKKVNLQEQRNISNRREEIDKALKNIGIQNKQLQLEMESFFKKIDDLFRNIQESENQKINLTWLINKSQIDRISKLIHMIDENNATVDKYYTNINKFTNIINHFLNESGKRIEIDNIGNLKIIKPNDKHANIDALSSGERQLLVIFSHLIFKNESNPSGVFIIDEPELSLHLRWQEEFVQYALECSPKTQLILATHSPEIIADHERKTIQISNK